MSTPVLCPHCLGQIQSGLTECPFCHKSLQNCNPEGVLPFGFVLGGRYTLGRCLAVDGEGCLYEAVENAAALRVTVKEYFPVTLCSGRGPDNAILPKEGSEVLFKTTRMDFQDLFQTLMRVTPATGLAAVLDTLELNNTVYAVLEKPQGKTLTDYLADRGKPLAPAEVRSLLSPVMEGVALLHKAGLLHRGICPENIRISEGGVACLSGYATLGLRSAGGELKWQLYEGFSAPEQYTASEFEGRYTDVYALAATTYWLVTGQTPVSARQRRTADSLESAHALDSTVPTYFSNVLEQAMRLDPAQRIQNAPELIGALASPAAANAVRARTAPAQEGISTRRILAAALLIIVILLLLLFWAFLQLTGAQDRPVEAPSSESTAASSEAAAIQIIPNFVGMAYTTLQYDQQTLALYRFVVTESYDSKVEKGIVLSQSPEAGSLQEGETPIVQLVISKGPNLIEMPNIIGFTQENAVNELNAEGIQFSLLMLANNGEYAAGCVARVDPAAGTMIDTGKTIVNVYIAAERDNTAAPVYEEAQEDSTGG